MLHVIVATHSPENCPASVDAIRDNVTRHASICVAVIHARSNACKPYSPNETDAPRQAIPARLPRCCLRCLTLEGINGISKFPYTAAGEPAGAPTGFASGKVSFRARSPLQTQIFTPILPYTVFASAKP